MDAQPAPASPVATSARGLSTDEVRQRVASGRTNLAPPSASPPVRRILARNLLSPINFVFAVAVRGLYRAERVGRASPGARLTAEAQQDKEPGSSIQRDLIGLLTKIAFIATPVPAAYFGVELPPHLGPLETVRGTVTAAVSVL